MSVAATKTGPCPHALRVWIATGTGHRRRWHPATVACRHDAGHEGQHRNRRIGGERW